MFRSYTCKGRAVYEVEQNCIRIVTGHNEHPSPVMQIRARAVEFDVMKSVTDTASIREILSLLCNKFKAEGIPLSYMTNENTLEMRMKRRRSKTVCAYPAVKTFYDLGMIFISPPLKSTLYPPKSFFHPAPLFPPVYALANDHVM